MATPKPYRRARPPKSAPAPQRATYAFGVTLAQIDRFNQLLRTISAHSDMVAVCSGAQLDDASLTTLGESIFDSAREVRGLVDAIYAQRLSPPNSAGEG